ncbi:MAG: hypothetical protein U5J95_10445 [Balneolaceae bacterium]|nr:hypothetical protein [Balneolaceae bacterium]
MEGEIFVITIVAIGCATGIITSWLKNRRQAGGIDQEVFERLAKAFMRHKKDAERRIQNLEAIIADDTDTSPTQIEEPKNTIEIEDEKEQKSKSGNSNLSNMLRE